MAPLLEAYYRRWHPSERVSRRYRVGDWTGLVVRRYSRRYALFMRPSAVLALAERIAAKYAAPPGLDRALDSAVPVYSMDYALVAGCYVWGAVESWTCYRCGRVLKLPSGDVYINGWPTNGALRTGLCCGDKDCKSLYRFAMKVHRRASGRAQSNAWRDCVDYVGAAVILASREMMRGSG